MTTDITAGIRPFGRLDRREVVAALLKDRGDMLLVTGLGSPTYDAAAVEDHDANFYLWGAMGGAAVMGLGLALAQPDRSVLVLTGDGEQLMGLGGLATIAVKHPANLSVVVLDNGHYGETGMQTSHTGFGLKLPEVATACGFRDSIEIEDMTGVEQLRTRLHGNEAGPRFASIRIAPTSPERVLPSRDGVRIKNRFRDHLGLV
jgi:thiamine pyrophosphate-dependent acetolactate synthase large subunit-like protein